MKFNESSRLLRNKNILKASRRLYSTCKKSDNKKSKDGCKVNHEDLRCCKDDSKRFIKECLIKAKACDKNADQQAALLIAADLRGHYSHGMNRLEMYLNELEAGVCDGRAEPQILKETPAAAWVGGCNALGAVTGNFCMQLAIKKAEKVGIGYVVAKGGCHYGMAGYYTLQAVEKGLIGYSSTNTSPLVAPTRSKQACLGTNPLSIGMPSSIKEDYYLLDMATSAVALGKLEMARRLNKPIPLGWALGPDGQPTADPAVGYKNGILMPLGGAEETSGYKGYGLACMVEALGSMLSGSQ
ncbi:uncharacterized protein LOC113386430 [Ctenocephalides felis]|uniref:uncharacterized protein LOC113386430 n=1 Tax=Ctenocephalides felis TaxID=7515 RepID=UPI000E6E199B|nr:uncharacterized protein LOC113386430 [Ctenocephalides felis]